MSRLLIAWGNPLRGDDGVAARVAAEVAELDPTVEVVVVHQPTPELAERLAGAERAVLVDAAADLPPGEVAVRPLGPAPGGCGLGHELDPGSLLQLAARVFGRAPDAHLVVVGVGSAAWGEELSPPLAAALSRAAATALRALGS